MRFTLLCRSDNESDPLTLVFLFSPLPSPSLSSPLYALFSFSAAGNLFLHDHPLSNCPTYSHTREREREREKKRQTDGEMTAHTKTRTIKNKKEWGRVTEYCFFFFFFILLFHWTLTDQKKGEANKQKIARSRIKTERTSRKTAADWVEAGTGSSAVTDRVCTHTHTDTHKPLHSSHLFISPRKRSETERHAGSRRNGHMDIKYLL